MEHSLIIFASGKGSNAAAIIDYFRNSKVKTALIVSNNKEAGVLDIARKEHIPYLIVDKQTLKESLIIKQIQSYQPTLILLAGFLWKIPQPLLQAFPNRIVNLHPSLLPEFGGKGMYGQHVHRAVLQAGKEESGISIHYVNEVYDSGRILIQARCKVLPGDSPEKLAERIHKLEHFYFPRTIEFLLKDKKPLTQRRHIEVR